MKKIREEYSRIFCLQGFYEVTGKAMVSCFGKVDTVIGKADIPVAGIKEVNVQLFSHKSVFIGKADGFVHQRICGNPCPPLHWRGCHQ